MAAEVEFENFEGIQHALYEDFPLGGSADMVKCLVIQNEDGRPPLRVKAGGPEHKALAKRYKALDGLDAAEKPAADAAPAEKPADQPQEAA